MSSLGAAPGYAYPELSYSESEFMQNSVNGFTAAVAGGVNLVVAAADKGDAILLRSCVTAMTTSAAVGSRSVGLLLLDQDNNFLQTWTNPLILAASSFGVFNFASTLANSYVVGTTGFSPIQEQIIPMGYRWLLQLLGLQIGDTVNISTAGGIRIPASPAVPVDIKLTPQPLMV